MIRIPTLLSASVVAFAVAAMAPAASAQDQDQDQSQKLAKLGVQFAANNARVASEVCGVDASTVSNYKNAASQKFVLDPDFAKDWDAGWKGAAQTVNGLQQMKTSNPQEYDQQKGAICSDMQREMKS
jgi:hypothetical protein